MRRGLGWLGAMGSLLALGCATEHALSRARALRTAGDLDGARRELEQARAADPEAVDVRVALGRAYYEIARHALDVDHDEARYLASLEQANAELLSAIEIEPRTPAAQYYVGVVAVYRGDLERALRGLENYRRLEQSAVAYTNIGEIHVYRGDLDEARRWTERGAKAGVRYSLVTYNEMLIAWKSGDLTGARDCFAKLQASDPDRLQNIDSVRLPQAPASFEAFAAHCCGSPGCGPYMRDACEPLGLGVK